MPTIKIVPFPGVPGPQGPRGLQGIQGEQGLTGPLGPTGKSAYEIAVDNGFEGTEQQWIDSISEPSENSFTVIGGSLGTQPTFNGSPLFSGSYVKHGPLVHFQIQVDMDNITDFGTGQYYVRLPFPSKYGYDFRDGCLHDISASRTYHISGHVYPGEQDLLLFATDSVGNNVFDFPFSNNQPITLSAEDNFHIAGSYICE